MASLVVPFSTPGQGCAQGRAGQGQALPLHFNSIARGNVGAGLASVLLYCAFPLFRGKSIDEAIRVTTHDGYPEVFATVHLEQHKEPDENSNDGHDVAGKCDGEAQQEANKRDNADEVQDAKQHGHAPKKDD